MHPAAARGAIHSSANNPYQAGWRGRRATLPGRVLFSLILSLALLGEALSATVAHIGPETEHLDLKPYMRILHDPANQLGVEQALSPEMSERYRPASEIGNSFGFTNATYWVKFSLHVDPAVDQDLLLEIPYPSLDHILLFSPSDSGRVHTLSSGEGEPFNARPIAHRNHLFPIHRHPGKTTHYLLRIRSEGSIQIPLVLWSNSGFIQHQDNSNLVLGAYYGIMLLLFLAAVTSYIRTHDRLFLHYAVYLLVYPLFQASLNGLAYQYLWPELPNWASRLTGATGGLAVLGILLISASFLNLQQRHPKLMKLYYGFTLITVLVIGINLFGDFNTGVVGVTVLGLILPPTVLAVAIRVALLGDRTAQVFLFAWCVFLAGVFIAAARYIGLLPNNFFTVYAIQIGSMVEILLLGYALTARIDELRKAKQQAIVEANARLESVVRERTEELQNKNRELANMAIHDSLTGLLNHGATQSFLKVLVDGAERYGNSLAVMMLDIDHFKAINDRFGHQAGDQVIRAVADVLKAHTRESDGCGRIGGEEFLLILPEATRQSTLELAERLRQLIERLRIPAIQGHIVTVSIGVAINSEQPADSDLIKIADSALYAAKHAGRNQVVINDLDVANA